MRTPELSLPLYIVDASAWAHHRTRNAITEYIDQVVGRGVIMTCPPASLEYYFMARNKAEHDVFRSRMAKLKPPIGIHRYPTCLRSSLHSGAADSSVLQVPWIL